MEIKIGDVFKIKKNGNKSTLFDGEEVAVRGFVEKDGKTYAIIESLNWYTAEVEHVRVEDLLPEKVKTDHEKALKFNALKEYIAGMPEQAKIKLPITIRMLVGEMEV